MQGQERFISLILTSYIRSFRQIGSKLKTSGPLGKFTAALIFLAHCHEMRPPQGFTVSHAPSAVSGAARSAGRATEMSVTGLCPCRASSLDCGDNWVGFIHSGPLHREPWGSEKEGDVTGWERQREGAVGAWAEPEKRAGLLETEAKERPLGLAHAI